jgi:hypothetical protein
MESVTCDSLNSNRSSSNTLRVRRWLLVSLVTLSYGSLAVPLPHNSESSITSVRSTLSHKLTESDSSAQNASLRTAELVVPTRSSVGLRVRCQMTLDLDQVGGIQLVPGSTTCPSYLDGGRTQYSFWVDVHGTVSSPTVRSRSYE